MGKSDPNQKAYENSPKAVSYTHLYEKADDEILDLDAGRIQMVAGDKGQSREYEKLYDVEIIWEGSFYGTGENIAVPKNEPDLLNKINSILGELKDEGFLEGLAEKWQTD